MERTPGGEDGRPCILVLHDIEDVRRLLILMLQTEGYQVSGVSGEIEAVEVARTSPPQLILQVLGISTPDALATANRIRNGALVPGVPVVIVSTDCGDGAEIDIGGNVHLVRPEDSDQLKRLVARLLAGRLLGSA